MIQKIRFLLKKIAAFFVAIFSGFIFGFCFSRMKNKKTPVKKNEDFINEIKETPASDIVNSANDTATIEQSKQKLKTDFNNSVERIKDNFFQKGSFATD